MGTLKVRIGIFCCLLIAFSLITTSSLWAVQRASIVICAETGKIYHQQNVDAITHPASLTKMMTLYLTFKALREGKLTFNQELPVSKRATQVEPSKLWLKAGSTISVRHAILALVTKSANDAAVVLAEALGNQSEPHFAVKMTQQARQLGMSNTVFKNASGLPNKAQVTTARDMATLSRCLYKHFPEYFKFFKEQKFAYKGQVHANHNHLLGRVPGVDGIKTGFIHASGFNLAASMIRGNHRIIAVVLGGESIKARDNKVAKLLEATHLSLTGKNGLFPKHQSPSIEDLICASENSQTIPAKAKVHKAVMRGQCRPAKIMTAKYNSVDDLLSEFDEFEESPKIIRVKKPEPFAKRVKKYKLHHPHKQDPHKHSKHRAKKLEPKKHAKAKKPTVKKGIKKGKQKLKR